MKEINKVVKVLILTDIALVSGIGFVTPIFAIFLTQQIQGGNVKVAGYAAAIYWIVKSIITIPFGKYLDKNHGEKDDLYFILIGNILVSLAVFGYAFSRFPWHIYVLESIYAFGIAMNIPGFTAIFTRHIDKGKEAFEWSTHSASISLGSGIAGAVGGIIVFKFGFATLFLGVALFMFITAFLPLLIRKDVSSKNEPTLRFPEDPYLMK